MNTRYCYIFLVAFGLIIWSPRINSQPFRLQFQHLTIEDGLSQSYNSYLLKDSRGFMWISSMDGLNRYDGQNIRIYQPDRNQPNSLSGNYVNSPLFEDESENLWFATYDAINCYLRDKDHFEHFRLRDEYGALIREDYYVFHLDEKKQLWVRTGQGQSGRLHLFNTETQEDRIVGPLDGYRCRVVTDQSGKVRRVVSSMMPVGGGFEIRDIQDGKISAYQSYFRAPSGDQLHITSVFPESDTLYWLASDDGLIAFDPVGETKKTYAKFEQKNIGKPWYILPYGEEALFVSSSRGLYVFDRSGRRFIQHFQHLPDVNETLIKNSIQELYLDNQDNLWITMWAQGLEIVNLKKNRFPGFLSKSERGSETIVHCIHEDAQSNIWCGSNRGIFVFDAQKKLIEHFDNDDGSEYGFDRRVVYFIISTSDDEIWAAFKNKIYSLNIHSRDVRQIVRTNSPLHYLKILSDGRTMIATEKGIWEYTENHPSKLKLFPGLEPKQESSFTAIYEDRNNQLYLSENAENLLIYQLTDGRLEFKKQLSGMGYCKAFLERPGQEDLIWIATTRGLIRMNTRTFEFELLNEKNGGIPAETFYSVLADETGALWLSSNNGLIKYMPQQQTMKRYTRSDGLQGAEFNTNAYLKSSAGEMWFGGGNGINVFHPRGIDTLSFLPDIQFIDIKIDDEPDTIPVAQREKTGLRLPYHLNTVSFEFVGMDYSDVNHVQFQYRMLGYDRNWVFENRRGFARYSNLPPGDYTFQVKSANSDGIWTPDSKDIKIHIQTPFWQSWWFLLLCFLAVSGILYGWFRYRLEQALKIERMRVKISSDLHDDVGTLLSGLAMQSELLEYTASGDDKPRLKRIADMSRAAMSRMRDTVWAIDSRKDKFENLLDRMREHAEETLSARDISFTIDAGSINLKTNLPSNVRQNIYLVYKEAITNIAKHSNADQVKISLRQTGKPFVMKIHDNGQVTEKAYKTTGLGSENMNMRAEQIGGRLEVRKDQGYEIVLQVPDLQI